MPKNFRAKVSDIHSHDPLAPDSAVINLDRYAAMRPDHRLYSVGWHPWWPDPDMDWVERTAADPRIVIIGECGLDRRRGALALGEQIELTRAHALLAERLEKPLLLHVVGAWSEIIALRRQIKPQQPWIIHGFRGKPQLARQLLDAGFDISLGVRFNPEAEAIIPPERLHRETDSQPPATDGSGGA